MKTTQINKLRTVKNFALSHGVTAAYIYKMMGEKKMNPVIIDGVKFIDISVYPNLPTK
jgi:hypothetical protein